MASNTMVDSRATMNILVVGNIFTGKSALINNMIGKDVAEEAADAQYKGTSNVNAYDYSVEGFTGKFWDTPGLQDHEDDTDDDDRYIREMKEEGCHKADIMLYCINLSNTRFHEDDKKTIMNLTKELGKGIWEKAIFVLTFANDVIARLELKYSTPCDKLRPGQEPVHVAVFKEVISKWEKALSAEIQNAGVSSRVAESIPVVRAGYETSDELYLETDDTNWIESLWHICKVRVQKPLGWFKRIQHSVTSMPKFSLPQMSLPQMSLSWISLPQWGRRDSGESGHEQATSQARPSILEPQAPVTTLSAKRESSIRTKQAEESDRAHTAEERAALRSADLKNWSAK